MLTKNKLIKFEILSTITIAIIGFLLHFTFKLSNSNTIIGIFSAVNESVWEHLKLLFFPSLITIIIGSSYFKNAKPYYLCYKVKGLILASLLIIVFHYTYTGILGHHIPIVDISIFMLSIIFEEYYTYKNLLTNVDCNKLSAIIAATIITLCFLIFTFTPPKINLFKDPITQSFGIKKIY